MRGRKRLAALALAALPVARVAAQGGETFRDERMIVASDTVVITFDGTSVKLAGSNRSARLGIYLAKPDDHGATRYRVDVEADCARKLQRELTSTGYRPDGTSPQIAAEPRDHDFKPVKPDTFQKVIQDHLCAIERTDDRKGGVFLSVPGELAARGVFALLALGIENEHAAQLASQPYVDADMLKASLTAAKVPLVQRAAVVKALDAQIAPKAKPPLPIVPLASAVVSGHVGKYVHSEMELVAGLWLKADGTFEYFLTVGSLDETAKGRWTASGDHVALVNVPPPVRPTITAGAAVRDAKAGLRVKVTTPSGRGVPGVDLVIGFDRGDAVHDYTQGTGWTLSDEDKRAPRWITLAMPSYGLSSPRFPIDVAMANDLTFLLTPNDIGVVDLSKARIVADREGLTVERQGQPMRLEKRR